MWEKQKNKLSNNALCYIGLVFFCFCILMPQTLLAQNIPSSYLKIADEYQVPPEILYGIALAESGKRLRSKKYRPWPWTLNVSGIPRRYFSRKAAYQGLLFFLRQGIRSVDIGLMQVNWKYHHKKLGTLWQALDPYNNIKTGARILHSEYQKTRDWKKAIGYYHSPGQKPKQKKRAKNYAARVIKQIKRLNSNSGFLQL